jgi:hypothetical protein
VPPSVSSIGNHLELLAPVQPRAIDVNLEWDEASDRELVQPRMVHAQNAGCTTRGNPIRRRIVEMVTPAVHPRGERFHVPTRQPTAHIGTRGRKTVNSNVDADRPSVAPEDARRLLLVNTVNGGSDTV